MYAIMSIKESLKKFYGKYDIIVDALVKFALALTACLLMRKNVGWVEIFSNPFVIAVISLTCCILPYGLSTVVLALCLMANIFRMSVSGAVVLAVILVVMALMYYSFHPGDTVLIVLTPVLFALKIPYTLPLIAGLSCGVTAFIPIGCGTVIYYLVRYIRETAELAAEVSSGGMESIPTEIIGIIDSVIINKKVLLMVAVFTVILVAVHVIRRLPLDYSKYIAVGVGILGLILMSAILKLDISLPGFIISSLAAVFYSMFIMNLDYSRSIHEQFEDDNFYYYVKAVPKLDSGENRKSPELYERFERYEKTR